MSGCENISNYRCINSALSPSNGCLLLPALLREAVAALQVNESKGRRVFELSCGVGIVPSELTQQGFDVTGVHLASEGIARATSPVGIS